MANADMAAKSPKGGGLTKDERFVIIASSTGTIFEWYDFYLYATLAPFFAALFFPPGNETAALLSAFATYAAGFLVRPFGALFFGRIGDLVGRKYTFLVTVLVMGLATFGVGLLPTYSTIGFAAPVLLLILRLLQGLALGGEYGGAATYVAEHARPGRRGYATSWIQTTATLGFFLSLLVIGVSRLAMPTAVFADWGWRLPFLVSALLLIYSIWVRLKLQESPIFAKMKAEGKGSTSPLRDSFLKYPNNKLVLLALLGATAGQGVVWYTGQFYALFFLNITQQVDYITTYLLIGGALLLGTPFFVIFGSLSDRIGRLYIILAGCLIAALSYFTLFGLLAQAVNPGLYAYQQKAELHVAADPANCHFNVFVFPGTVFGDCDRGKDLLTKAGLSFISDSLPAGSPATLTINGTTTTGFTAASWSKALLDSGYPNLKATQSSIPLTPEDVAAITAADVKPAAVTAALNKARLAADPAAKKLATVTQIEPIAAGATVANVTEYTQKTADTSKINYVAAIAILWIMVIFVTMVYGPIAAYLVELFPTRIRYTSMSLPYHIGNGWFGGLLPLVATAMVAAAGNIYFGLWFPIVVALMSVVIGGIFLRDTKGKDIDADL
ncbi:MFS transporter [Devosia sp.]|uniref:MFS transporter n=1 Tax=Devosia sp. TaxID=1871048 RepID=UPI003265081B